MASIVSSVLLGVLCALCVVKWGFAYRYIVQFNEGPCPNVTGTDNFTINQIVGYWYKVRQYNLGNIRCARKSITLDGAGNLLITLTYRRRRYSRTYTQNLIAVPRPGESEILNVTARNDGPEPYWNEWIILHADPNCFTTYSCNNANGTGDHLGHEHNEVALTIICRDRYPTQQQIQPALDAITARNISIVGLRTVDQRCGYRYRYGRNSE